MISTAEFQWIEVNNHALDCFGGVPIIVGCDNCKQAVMANRDWIDPDLNKDYAAWTENNHTVILPAKVRKPKWKSSLENAVGIFEKGFFHDLEEKRYFSLEQFNRDLWAKLDMLNHENFKKKDFSRYDQWIEERHELLPLPPCITRTSIANIRGVIQPVVSFLLKVFAGLVTCRAGRTFNTAKNDLAASVGLFAVIAMDTEILGIIKGTFMVPVGQAVGFYFF